MPFSQFKLHPDLIRGLKDLGFARPTPIQADAIPPAIEGRDVLACAMTGSGKTAAFLLPILHQLIGKPRGTTRALILTPTRELAAQILEDLNDLTVHTPITARRGLRRRRHGAAGARLPQRRRRHRRHARAPARSLPRALREAAGIEFLVLDEADRMLDMGFLPDIRRVLRHLPDEAADAVLQRDDAAADRAADARDAARSGDDQPRAAVGAGDGHHAGGVSGAAAAQGGAAARAAAERRDAGRAGLHAHQAPRRPAGEVSRRRTKVKRRADSRQPLAGAAHAGARRDSRAGRYQVLVATDIAARGIDVTALGHVINFDVPAQPEDYIHRVGRTARAELTGVGVHAGRRRRKKATCGRSSRRSARRLPRVTVPDFDYTARAAERLEVPHAQRIAEIRARKAEERARARANAERRAGAAARPGTGSAAGTRPGSAPWTGPGTAPRTGPGSAARDKVTGSARARVRDRDRVAPRPGRSGTGSRPQGQRHGGRRRP